MANASPQYGPFPQLPLEQNPYGNPSAGGKPQTGDLQRQWAQYAEYVLHPIILFVATVLE